MNSNIKLICTPLLFYTQYDKDFLFRWLRKVKSITDIKGIRSELHLSFPSNDIPKKELFELISIFGRYQFENPNQLKNGSSMIKLNIHSHPYIPMLNNSKKA